MAIKPEEFDMSTEELEATFEAEGKCRHGVPKEEPCGECEDYKRIKKNAGGVNISAAEEVALRAEFGEADREEIGDMIKTLEEIQNDPANAKSVRDDVGIQRTLARLRAARNKKA